MLSDPVVSAGWGPGEAATVTITMTNPTAVDMQYPGISVSPDNPLVTPPEAYNAFFVLFANTSMPIDVGFMADASITSGTKVTFQASVMDIQSNLCPNIDGLTFEATVQ